MTKEELIESLKKLQRECDEKKEVVRELYANEHNPVSLGDIVTDHYHTVKVDKMIVTGYPVPYMCYFGTELTKQGVPKKRQPYPRQGVYQRNVKMINGKLYLFNEE